MIVKDLKLISKSFLLKPLLFQNTPRLLHEDGIPVSHIVYDVILQRKHIITKSPDTNYKTLRMLGNMSGFTHMDKHYMWIHYERLHNHNKVKHNKTVCIFLGVYCKHVTKNKAKPSQSTEGALL